MKLAKVLYVAVNSDGDDQYLQAAETVERCIEDDGPTVIGTYKLIEKAKYEKVTTKKD